MAEPDYRSFENKPTGGNALDEREDKLRKQWKEWKRNKKKVWYL